MTKEQAERVLTKIQQLGASGEVQMTEKDVDVLGKLLGSEPMVKALALVYSAAHKAPERLLTANFEDPQQRREATLLQGQVYGLVHCIDTLFATATVEETEESDVNAR